MKILVIGGNGTIGKKVSERLTQKHEVLIAGRHSGDVTVDFADSASIKNMFESIGKLDAIVTIAGDAKWDKLDNLSEDDFYIGIKSKMMGQVNVVRIGKDYLNANGSITLSTGILADDPVDMTTSAAMVNGAINSFTKAMALELEDGKRINVVCSDLVEDSFEKYKDYFPGNTPVPMHKIVDGYVKSIEGKITGRILRILA
jgi:NAD(P)-dependent dehydrogenase (short-subunit alcohol dehydrogenase family)